jgi:hypothetical protein
MGTKNFGRLRSVSWPLTDKVKEYIRHNLYFVIKKNHAILFTFTPREKLLYKKQESPGYNIV